MSGIVRLAIFLAVSIAIPKTAIAEQACDLCVLGEKIYNEGIGSSGKALTATVQGDVTVSGSQLSCISCHRRSGLGASESNVFIPPITADKLYKPKEERRQKFYRTMYQQQASNPALRPAYNDNTLMQAITEGIRPDGHPLSPLMPRFNLNTTDKHALLAYLKTLQNEDDPGVDDQYIHFATIIGPHVAADKKNALLSVLDKYFTNKNAATRNEDKRAANPFWFKRGNWDAYRKWKLHVWQLEGQRDTWAQQIQTLYEKNNVFAVISPVAKHATNEIHQFCEKNAVPCLWHNTDTPNLEGSGLFNVYFSRGMDLEANAIANKLAGANVLQIVGDDYRAKVAADALEKYHGNTTIKRFDEIDSIDDNEQHIALWLDENEISYLTRKIVKSASGRQLYFSSTLVDPKVVKRKFANGWVLHRHSPPARTSRGQQKAAAWLKQQAIELHYPTLQTDTYFACTLLTGTIKKLQDVYSRQYLIEKIEHMTENSVSTASYSHLSLAPDQRFASKGIYFVPFGHKKNTIQWLIPQ